ncbi:MAG: methyl-accepting chemotaxis protein [Treponema sp.]|nr:methyl-accepting chemotaxis protein [Treponema sp.]
MKLGIRISLIIGAVVFATSASIGLISLQISSSVLNNTIRSGISDSNETNADLISETINGQLGMLSQLASRPVIRSMDWGDIRQTLEPDVARFGAMDLGLICAEGILRYAVEGSEVDVADRTYFLRAMAGEQNVELVFSRISGAIVALFVAPIFASDEPRAPVLGALVARKDGGLALSNMVVSLRSSFPSGHSYLIDNSGTVIAHRDAQLVRGQFNAIAEARADDELSSLAGFVSTALDQRKGMVSYRFNGHEMLGHFTEIPSFPWILISTIEAADADAEIVEKRIIIIAVGIGCLLAGLVVAFFVGRSIAKPVRRMVEMLKDISEGEGDLTRSINIHSKDEIGDLALYFNHTLEKIRDLVVNIKSQSGELNDIGNDLASNMTETASAMNEITANIQSVKGRVMTQSASVTQTNATMEQVSGNIDKLSGHVEMQANAVSLSSSAIEEMMANIQSVTATLAKNSTNIKTLQESSELGRSGLQDVAQEIQEIARDSEGLLEINSVMENIASQTNLLSMNAAIEAAHAGDAGRGFAVVADEIRKLAESSTSQSKTIGDVLKKIKDAIDKITLSTGSVLERFEAIDRGVRTVAEQSNTISAAMEEQNHGSRQILKASAQVNEITQQVKGGSIEMLEGSREVIHESKNLERVTQEITHGINEMAAGTEQVNKAVDNVNNLSNRNRESISSLVRAVSQFKV